MATNWQVLQWDVQSDNLLRHVLGKAASLSQNYERHVSKQWWLDFKITSTYRLHRRPIQYNRLKLNPCRPFVNYVTSSVGLVGCEMFLSPLNLCGRLLDFKALIEGTSRCHFCR